MTASVSSQTNADRRPFLDAAETETTADLGALRKTLSKAVHGAEALGLSDVRERVEATVAHAVEQHEEEA